MTTKKADDSNHYVNNKEFYQHMIGWKKDIKESESVGEKNPPVTDYIGECFLKIAEHLSYKPNFINYPYREEMIGDGIENCIMYAHNFDPEKSKNPFSYFTQIIYYAFLRRIQKEKKQSYIKYKAIEAADIYNEFPVWINNILGDDENKVNDVTMKYFNLSETDIEKFTPKKKQKKTTTKKKEKKLDKFLED